MSARHVIVQFLLQLIHATSIESTCDSLSKHRRGSLSTHYPANKV